MITKGQKIRIAYELTVEGRLIKSIQQSRPFCFTYGKRCAEIPDGLGKAMRRMSLGDRLAVRLLPKEARGAENPKLIMEMPKKRFSKRYHFVGREVNSESDGKYLATVKEVRKETLVLNFNHPLAGKTLHYNIFVVGIEGQTVASLKASGMETANR